LAITKLYLPVAKDTVVATNTVTRKARVE